MIRGAIVSLFVCAAAWAQCNYLVSPTVFNVSAGSAVGSITGTVRITAPAGCDWKAASNASWLSINVGASGSGNGTVGWSADRNTFGSARSGTLTVAGQTVTINQAGASCDYNLPITSAAFPVSGGSSSFLVKTSCSWAAVSSQPWITATGGGTVDGTVNYTVAPNLCVADRAGAITVGAASFQITQAGSSTNLQLSPTNLTAGSSGGDYAVTLTTGTGCAWTAQSSQSWAQITAGASGSGNGTIRIRVAANTGAQRTALIAVGSQTVLITQAAAPAVVQVTAVTNGASFQTGSIAPGEIVTLFGSGMGPADLVTLQLTPDGTALTNSLAETRVLFNGIPAPVIYTSEKQVSVIVPYGVAGQPTATVQVEYKGVRGSTVTVPVEPTAPALFTLDASGRGPGAILNQDFTVNGAQNPAPAGSVVMLYGTGEGLTDPVGVDGKLAAAPLPAPRLPVTVRIGGLDARVWYAGAAQGLVAGLVQINAEIPAGVAPGPEVPVVIRTGGKDSPAGVTLAVK